jgi:hypothetical protein
MNTGAERKQGQADSLTSSDERRALAFNTSTIFSSRDCLDPVRRMSTQLFLMRLNERGMFDKARRNLIAMRQSPPSCLN